MSQIHLSVSDYMSRNVITVLPQTEITQVVRMLIEHDISGLIVVNDLGAVVGMVTERDCIAVASAAGYYEEWGGPVERYMATPVETVAPDDGLIDVAARMAASRHRRFPVLEDGRLVGLLTRRDVLRAIEDGSWPTS